MFYNIQQIRNIYTNMGYQQTNLHGTGFYILLKANKTFRQWICLIDAVSLSLVTSKQIQEFIRHTTEQYMEIGHNNILCIIARNSHHPGFHKKNILYFNFDNSKRLLSNKVTKNFIVEKKVAISYARQNQKKQYKKKRLLNGYSYNYGIMTALLILANILAYLLFAANKFTFAVSYENLQKDSSCILKYMFLHANISHLVGNMFALYYIGKQLEHRIGPLHTLFIYISSGTVSGIVSAYLYHSFNINSSTIGASGAIFGLLGALMVNIIFDSTQRKAPIIRYVIITFIASSIGYNVDVIAHAIGLLAGAYLSLCENIYTVLSGKLYRMAHN